MTDDAATQGHTPGGEVQGDAALCFLNATELARRLRRKDVSAHLTQIARVNPTVNAIVTLVADQTLAQAQRADDALARGL